MSVTEGCACSTSPRPVAGLVDVVTVAGMVTDLSGKRLDEDVQTCDAGGWTLVTSRDPDDLDAFVAAAAAVLA